MRFLLAIVLVACGGQTSAPIDAGPDVPALACFADGREPADRQCSGNGDCAVLDRQSDCCGSVEVDGVRIDRVDAIHEAELSGDTGCEVCKCAPKPTADESGQTGTTFVASCDQGVCTAHAQF